MNILLVEIILLKQYHSKYWCK